MELIFHGKFSLYDTAIFGCKYIKIPLKAKRMGKEVALSGNFNILRATLSAQIGHGMTEKGICEVQSGFLIRLSFA